MALLDIHLCVDEAVERYCVAIDGENVVLDGHKGRVEVDDRKKHQLSILLVGPAGSSLRFRIEQAGAVVAQGRGDIWPEGEPYGSVIQYFELPS